MNPIAVVICNYNKRDLALDCIASVFASDFGDFDLIVVDNASTDGSAEAIRERYGDKLTLLVNKENTGGSGGFNRGMTHAMERGYRYIHLLDNDVVIDKDAIGSLYEFMESHSEVGACGSLICRMDERMLIQDYGAMIEIDNLGVRPLYHNTIVKDDLPEYVACDYVAACSAMYRASVLQKTGAIDKEFFIYWDDMSLGWSIRNHGYRVYATKKSRVWHCHGLAEPTDTTGIYYFFRNKIYCFAKYANDEDFERLSENLVTRLFRTSIVNLNNQETLITYFNALNDALNNIRGKADPSKILSLPYVNSAFAAFFTDKKSILLVCKCDDFDMPKLMRKLKSVSSARIALDANGYEPPPTEGVTAKEDIAEPRFDATVILCRHILDEKPLDRRHVYIDRYLNQILTGSDFEAIANSATAQAVFEKTYGGFVRYKLDELRKAAGR
jgi:GT2 family glycosyltransferase